LQIIELSAPRLELAFELTGGGQQTLDADLRIKKGIGIDQGDLGFGNVAGGRAAGRRGRGGNRTWLGRGRRRGRLRLRGD